MFKHYLQQHGAQLSIEISDVSNFVLKNIYILVPGGSISEVKFENEYNIHVHRKRKGVGIPVGVRYNFFSRRFFPPPMTRVTRDLVLPTSGHPFRATVRGPRCCFTLIFITSSQ